MLASLANISEPIPNLLGHTVWVFYIPWNPLNRSNEQRIQFVFDLRSRFLITDQRSKSFVFLRPVLHKFDGALKIIGISRVEFQVRCQLQKNFSDPILWAFQSRHQLSIREDQF